MEIVNCREALIVRNSDMHGSTFTNINLGNASFIDVDLRNVSIKDANLTGMKINDVLVSELIRVYESRSR